MKSKNLLSQLADLEEALNSFSFEELTARDARRLKKSFDVFKDQLESRFFGESKPSENPPSDTPDSEIHTDGTAREEALIATVSHEIRTPLSGIVGFTDLLRETELTEEQTEQVRAIRSASRNLMEIINELLEYSKLSAGLENFKQVDFELDGVLQDVAYVCKSLMQDKEIEFQVDRDPQIPEYLKGDPSKLSQILLNLLGNSIKFVEKGSINLHVSMIKQRADRVWLELVISDTGIGISENELNSIFQSYRQANRQIYTKYGGTGLGLNIVKQIVEKLEGKLEVSSQVGVGTTFRITLEYGRGQKTKDSAPKADGISIDDVKGMKILVFEDNLMNQRLIEQRLRYWGCKTFITENPYYGLNLIENNQIDLVLMDLRMPLMNGLEVTRHIRNSTQRHVRQVPIIAVTADFTIEDKDQCEAGGINDYLLKPYSPGELLSKMVLHKKGGSPKPLKISQPTSRGKVVEKSTDLIDLSTVLEDCMGDMEVLRELVRLFKRNILEFIGRVKIHLENDDFRQIRDAAHKIKCGLAMMHAHSLYYIVEQIHNNCRNTRDIQHLSTLYKTFLLAYPEVEQAIDDQLEKMN